MFIPKIHFLYALPFDGGRRRFFQEQGKDYPDQQTLRNKTKEWQSLWDELNQNDKVIKRFIELHGVSLKRDVEVYVFGSGMNPMSIPFLLPYMGENGPRSDDSFVATMIHELSHVFSSRTRNPEFEDYWNQVESKYQNESVTTRHHIIVYAVTQTILKEIFGEAKMRELIEAKRWPDYQRAIDIVDETGADKLIQEFRELTNG